MPAIPQYQRQTIARGDTSPLLARIPDTSGAGMGDALAGFGAGLAQVGQQINAEREQESLHAASRSVAEFSAWQSEQLDALASKPAAEFETHRKAFESEAQKARSRLTSSAKRPATRQWIEARLAPLDERAGGRLRELTAIAMTGDKLDSIDATIAATAQAVARDPEAFMEQLTGVLSGIQGSGVQMQTQAAYGARARDALAVAGTQGLIGRDAARAATELADPNTRVAAIRNLDPQARQQLLQTALATASANRVNGEASRIAAAYAQDVNAGNAAAQNLSPQLSDAEQLEVRKTVAARLNLLQSERQTEYGTQIASIARRINAGTAGRQDERDLTAIYRRSGVSQSHFETLVQRLDDQRTKQAAAIAQATELQSTLSSGLPLDPQNTKHREALDSAFKLETQGASPGDTRFLTSAVAWANRTKLLPPTAAGWLRSAVRSPDAAVAGAAAQFYGQLDVVAPEAAADLDQDTKAFARSVSAMIDAGTRPDAAVEAVRVAMDTKPEVLERRKTAFEQHAKTNDAVLRDFAGRDFAPGLFESTPALVEDLAADFAGQTRRYFDKTGNIEVARDLAWQDLRRVYGVTEVNGAKTVTAFPPERFGITPADVRSDLAEFLKGNPQADGSKPEDLVIVPDALTLRSVSDVLAGGNASRIGYRIVTKSGDLAVGADGLPKRYYLPAGEALADKIRQAEARAYIQSQAEIAEAKRQRTQWLEFNANPTYFAPTGSLP